MNLVDSNALFENSHLVETLAVQLSDTLKTGFTHAVNDGSINHLNERIIQLHREIIQIQDRSIWDRLLDFPGIIIGGVIGSLGTVWSFRRENRKNKLTITWQLKEEINSLKKTVSDYYRDFYSYDFAETGVLQCQHNGNQTNLPFYVIEKDKAIKSLQAKTYPIPDTQNKIEKHINELNYLFKGKYSVLDSLFNDYKKKSFKYELSDQKKLVTNKIQFYQEMNQMNEQLRETHFKKLDEMIDYLDHKLK